MLWSLAIVIDFQPLSNVAESSLVRREPLSPRKEEQGVPFMVECRGLTLKVPLQGPSGNVYTQVLL